ncbi:hypothetical protein E7T06_00865 [Deinococcus sp. Arct2-2]|uniref:hypothetical protein n=1 Tax=Deinococcus sp. Arct2-2 TaxID=2568653 RepID=UPI0010A332A0|nr:hypothetical protein [Deinococcus sp. Arct2-2]THF71947.1 hypothetical protein E7T06_00865 [Deinococcus sp. Arct2-2]
MKDLTFVFGTLNYTYLRRCAWLSLTKRWGWIAGAALVGLMLGLAVSVATGLLAAGLGAVVVALLVAVHSALRHRTDWKARTDNSSPFLKRS